MAFLEGPKWDFGVGLEKASGGNRRLWGLMEGEGEQSVLPAQFKEWASTAAERLVKAGGLSGTDSPQALLSLGLMLADPFPPPCNASLVLINALNPSPDCAARALAVPSFKSCLKAFS